MCRLQGAVVYVRAPDPVVVLDDVLSVQLRIALASLACAYGGGVTLPGGGMVPGPEVEHANASGVSPGAAKGGSSGKVIRPLLMA